MDDIPGLNLEGRLSRPSSDLDVSVIMNDRGFIEVKSGEQGKRIGTASLGGCLAIAAIVEDRYGDRRCSLAHYDPMALVLELKREGYTKFPTVMSLFNEAGKVGSKSDLVKTAVLIISQSREGQQQKFVDAIRTEARYILGCDNVQIIKYGEVPSDHLEVAIPNSSSGNPNYSTATRKETVRW
jgi:hypothetical protein